MPASVTGKDRRLTPHETRLVEVIAIAAEQGKTLTREEAGTLAGYGKGEVARAAASRSLGRPEVRRALIERAAEIIAADAPHAAAMLRHVRQTGSAGQRLSAATETLKLTGMGQQDAPASGSVVVMLALPPEIATRLAQGRMPGPQVIDVEAESAGDTRPMEAGGAAEQPAKPARKPRDPSPAPAKKARAKRGRGQKRRPKPVARAARTFSSPKPSVSPDGTD